MLLAWCVFMVLRRPGWTLRGTVAGERHHPEPFSLMPEDSGSSRRQAVR